MKFSDITGHGEILTSLKRLIDEGKLPHALLFSGKSGLGKFRTARAVAQYIHCKNKANGEACGKCRSCLQHQKHNNPDLHFIYPIVKKEGNLISKDLIDEWRDFIDQHTFMPTEKWNEYIKAGNSQTSIYVTESEEIINRASLSSFQEDIKIFFIWQPEKLRPEAANKLLKIIEEPFEDTVFILVSNDPSKILPTILSRTQIYNFKPLDEATIQAELQKKGIEKESAREAASIAEGSLQKAEEMALHPDEFLSFSAFFKAIMRNAYALKAAELKELADEISSFGREKIIRFLTYCCRMIRENFIFNYGIPAINRMTEEEKDFSLKFAPFIHAGNVENMSMELSRAITDIERNANSKIVLFDLFLLFSRYVRQTSTTEFPEKEY